MISDHAPSSASAAVGSERHMQHLLGAKAVLEDVRGREHRLHIAAPQLVIERDIGVLASRQMLEIGEGAGRLQHIVDDGRRSHRLDFVEHRGQFLVFGGDRLHRALRDVRIGREHDRHGLADKAHLVERQHRLIVKGRAEIDWG